ncbi:hypothetical protein ACFSQ7_43925 [Paenibacillus rhizoplanae]
MSGWSGNKDVNVDKVIVGHWINLANTRYDYTPNPSVDFTNYSNKYLVPDTATAYYWNEKNQLSRVKSEFLKCSMVSVTLLNKPKKGACIHRDPH